MQLSIGSYSFHRELALGRQDIFKYITDCKAFGCTQLDPWNGHLAQLKEGDEALQAGGDPEGAQLSAQDDGYIERVRAAADDAGLPFGCLAVDGAHVYDDDSELRQVLRNRAYRWIDIAHTLGAKQIRLDSGGTYEMPDEMFDIIVEGYRDLVKRAGDIGIAVIMENHFGASQIPENVIRILEAVPEVGLLLDTNNWAEGRKVDGWRMCAPYAKATHIKTFNIGEDGQEATADLPKAINLLLDAGYNDVWGIESCPVDGDEYLGVQQTIALVERVLKQRAKNGVAHV